MCCGVAALTSENGDSAIPCQFGNYRLAGGDGKKGQP